MKADIFAGVGGVILSIIVWITSSTFPSFAVSKAGPSYYPRLIAIIFAISSIFLIIQAIKNKESCEFLSGQQLKKFAIVFIILFGYYFGMNFLGYFTATFLASFILAIYVFKAINKQTVLLSLCNSLLICGGIYVLFQILLKAPLPRGILF